MVKETFSYTFGGEGGYLHFRLYNHRKGAVEEKGEHKEADKSNDCGGLTCPAYI